MRYLKTYKVFESQNLDSLANQFLDEYFQQYDLRLGKPFDKEKANCSWFTKEFYNWAKSKSIDVQIVYFDSDREAHIAPMIDGQIIDFSVKQFTKNPEDDYLILTPEDYSKWGYLEYEILDEFPHWATVRAADKRVEFIKWVDFKKTEMYDCLKKAYFSFDSKEDEMEWGVSDINQYDVDRGSYFCTTDNCITHYRDNPGYSGEDDFQLDDMTIIALSDDYAMYDEGVRDFILQRADGFYCPEFDTYGLVIWNKNLIKR